LAGFRAGNQYDEMLYLFWLLRGGGFMYCYSARRAVIGFTFVALRAGK